MNEVAARDGLLLVSKPAGVTSHDVVERVRHTPIGAGRKVGHAGTLDPFATGLLLVLVGQATRVQRYLMMLPKSYRTSARFGYVSDTGDPTGNLTPTGARTNADDLRASMPALRGEVTQRVPLASAVKVGGERLYRKARRGERVETPTRKVHISRLELLSFDEREQIAKLEVDCSSGTYIRQLVADIGSLCGAGAYCQALERFGVGPFTLDQADEEALLPLARALGFMPERRLTPEEARRASHGRVVSSGEDAGAAGRFLRLTLEGELIAVAECRNGSLRPVTVLSHR